MAVDTRAKRQSAAGLFIPGRALGVVPGVLGHILRRVAAWGYAGLAGPDFPDEPATTVWRPIWRSGTRRR